jgi:hypothetical protein
MRSWTEPKAGAKVGAQTSTDIEPRPAIVVAGDGHIGLRKATSGGLRELIWEQEAAGSKPAIPTDQSHSSKLFLIFLCLLWQEDARRSM